MRILSISVPTLPNYASRVLAITKEQFNEEVYKQYYGSEFHFSLKDYALFHRLAILLMVFAVGCAVDPGLAPYNIEAERWFHLARAAMSRSYPIDQPTTSAIQCLVSHLACLAFHQRITSL